MRPLILSVVEELLARHRASARVELDDIAEAIGERVVTYDEVEFIVERLEAEGLLVGEPMGDTALAMTRGVLDKARELRSTLRRTPTVAEIATALGYSTHIVRRALQHGLSIRPAPKPSAE
jgi:uncharacterized membrane protein